MSACLALPLMFFAATPDLCPEVLAGNGLSRIEDFIDLETLKNAPAWGSALRGFLVTQTESAPSLDVGRTEFSAVLVSESQAYHFRQSVPLPARAVATLEVAASATKGQLWCVNVQVTRDSNGLYELRLESSRPQVFTVTLKGAGQTRVWHTSQLIFTSTGEFNFSSETERRSFGLSQNDPVDLWRTWRLLGLKVPLERPLPSTPVCPPETKWVVEPDDETLGSHDEGCVSTHCGFSASGPHCPQHGPRRSVFFNGRLRASGEMKDDVPVESTWHFWKPNGELDPGGR